MRAVLVGDGLDHVRFREEQRRAEPVARAGEDEVVEVGQRHDQPDVVLAHQLTDLVDVGRVADALREDVDVRVVERGRERVDVGRDRDRACVRESADDVDALPRAREEDRRHAREVSEGI